MRLLFILLSFENVIQLPTIFIPIKELFSNISFNPKLVEKRNLTKGNPYHRANTVKIH